MRYQIGLDKTSRKFNCPSCGKKRFVRYFNFTQKEYFPSEFGRCDREVKCGYFLKIGEYFKSNPNLKGYTTTKPPNKKDKKPTYLDVSIMHRFNRDYRSNNFIKFLASIFTREQVRSIINAYPIGTINTWPWQGAGATVFWQIDDSNRLRSGKYIHYNAKTGKRAEIISWYHIKAKLRNFNLSQCLFGLHLINTNLYSPISIVESEKTACIMSIIAPDTIWMATGSKNNVGDGMFEPIFHRDIILYPDVDIAKNGKDNSFEHWSKRAEQLKRQGYNIEVSDLLERKATQKQKENGDDIADFFIAQLRSRTICKETISKENTEAVELSSPEMKKLKVLKEKNPYLEKMIEVLELKID